MSPDVHEPVVVANAHCEGLAVVRVDAADVARVILYAHQLEADGTIIRVVTARLTMTRETMREIADQMLTESMVAAHHRRQAAEERRRKMD